MCIRDSSEQVLSALEQGREGADALVAEHIDWAMDEQRQKGQSRAAT